MAVKSGLQFTLRVDGLSDGKLVVVEFSGKDSISTPFQYNVELASRDESLKAQDIVDHDVELDIWQDGEIKQRIHGIVRSFSKGDTGFHFTRYSLIIVPAFARLALRKNSRIFQSQTVEAIIKTLLGEMKINDYVFSLSRKLQPREYCVQYNESDLAFIERLAAEEGIFYSFSHEKDKHTVVFSDNPQSQTKFSAPLPYNATAGGHAVEPFVNYWQMRHSIRSSSVQLKDYSFKQPAYSFLQESNGSELDFQQSSYEHYEFPGRYKDDTNGKAFARIRMEFLRRDALLAEAKSNIPGLTAGILFNLEEHLDDAMNRQWLLISLSCKGSQPQALEEEGGDGATAYSNVFSVIPGNRPWQAVPVTKPIVTGPQIATVVGPAGEEIYCDEFGRVKIQFPWDRYGQSDDKSSCWVRVSNGWAGAKYGFLAIPRIGHEVIVSFLEGDPDQPIITGRTYHATNMAPYILPNHKTRTVFKTDTHKGDGFNELRFEDEASREQIYIHGQKDRDVVINNISREFVGMDEHHKVGRNYLQMVTDHVHRLVGKSVTEEFGQDHHYKVGGTLIQRVMGAVNRWFSGGVITKIDGGDSREISGSEEKEIGANQRIKVANESYLNATNIVLEAGQVLTIKGPGGFIKIDSGGITISGNKVKINEGGSPGKGTAPSIVAPQEPDKPQQPDDPDERK